MHRTPLLLVCTAAAACAHRPVPAPVLTDIPLPAVEALETPALPAPHHAPPLSSLSVREKVAQLVMPWVGGDYWANDNAAMQAALRLVADQGVGGFVVGVGASPYDLAAKFNALQRASRLPLLIAADLESGPSMRIRGGTALPGNMALGAGGRELDAYEVGRIIALEARAVGIHLVFAPVLDVNNDPANPIINTRSFGEDPSRVAALGAAFIRGVEENGVMATAKHFPGHGDTGTDSHVALPVIAAGRARLDSIELVPFRAAVRAGVDAVMTAHIALPALTGTDAPATVSPVVLDTLLRHGLGFRGLVVTDALNMGAIVSRYGAARAAVLAFEAGADVLLMPADPVAAIDSLAAAVTSGEVSMARLDASVTRVFAAKSRAGLWGGRGVDLGRVAGVVGTAEHAALAQEIAERTLVLVRDSAGLVPLPPERRRSVVVVTYAEESNRDAGTWFPAALRDAVDTLRTFRIWPASGPASYDSVRAAVAGAGAVIFLAAARPVAGRPDAVGIPPALAALVEELSAAAAPAIVVSTGSPYLLAQVPHAQAYLLAWSSVQSAETAAARALLGTVAITGQLPVSLPPLHPLRSGLVRPGPAGGRTGGP